jgi:hypothetical protein
MFTTACLSLNRNDGQNSTGERRETKEKKTADVVDEDRVDANITPKLLFCYMY